MVWDESCGTKYELRHGPHSKYRERNQGSEAPIAAIYYESHVTCDVQ